MLEMKSGRPRKLCPIMGLLPAAHPGGIHRENPPVGIPARIRAERGFFRGVSRVSAPVVVIAFSLFIVSRLLLSRLFQPVKFKVSQPLLHIRGRSCLNGVAGIHAQVGPCDFVNYWWREGVFYTAVKLWDGSALFFHSYDYSPDIEAYRSKCEACQYNRGAIHHEISKAGHSFGKLYALN